MPSELFDQMDRCLREATQHAARALLLLDGLGPEAASEEHSAYVEVHSAMADLAGARILLSIST